MADATDAVFLEFTATAEPAAAGARPTRSRTAAVPPNEEPVFVEFTATAEAADPGTASTRSRQTVRGNRVLPLEVFAGLHPERRAEIVARVQAFAAEPEKVEDFDPEFRPRGAS